MAKLDKLCLRGVRSFGPQDADQQEIRFSSPITLILGQNGCGKTTIIESLKYACSGDLPSGDKTGFVNDPRLNNHAVVKAQVKLRLVDLQGIKYSIIKSMQVNQKQASQSFKSLDSTICETRPNGTSTDLSGRCGDVNERIAKILGVSKPILNNVVFCHQENALWPLDESKKLKEKFDEIFDASRYNKCIDSIRKLHKDKTMNLKILELELASRKDKMAYVQRQRQSLQEKEEKLASCEELATKKQSDLQPIIDRLTELSNIEANLQDLQKQCACKEAEHKGLAQQQQTLLRNIEREFEGSDQELRNEIDSFQTNKETEKAELNRMKGKRVDMEKQQNALSIQIDRKQCKIGELQEEKKQKLNTIKERSDLLKKCLRNLDLDVPDNLESDHVYATLIATIEQTLHQKQTDLKTMIAQNELDERKLDQTVNTCVEKLAEAKNSKASKEQQIREMRAKSRTINEQLLELDSSEERSKKYREAIARIERELETLTASFNQDQVSQEIDANRKRIRDLSEDLEAVEADYKILQQNMTVEASIDAQQQLITKRKAEILKLQNKHSDNFKTLFADKPLQPGIIKKIVAKHRTLNTDTIETINKKVNATQKNITLNETLLKTRRERLLEVKHEVENRQREITAICKQNPFEDVLKEVNATLETLQKKKGQYRSGKVLYEKFIEEFERDNPCCPVCSTNFQSQPQAVRNIVQSIKTRIQGIPDELKKVEAALEEKQQLQSKVLQLKPIQTKVHELTTATLPKLDEEINNLNEKLTSLRDELDTLLFQLVDPQLRLKAADEVFSDSALIDQYQLDIDKANTSITDLRLELRQVASKRTRQEVETAIDSLRTELETVRRDQEESQKRLEKHKERCQTLRDDKTKLVEQQLNLQKAAQGRLQLEDQLAELTAKEKELTQDVAALEMSLKSLQSDKEEACMNKTFVRESNTNQVNDARKLLNESERLFGDVRKVQRKLDEIIAKKTDEQFARTLDELQLLKDRQTAAKKNEDDLAAAIAEFTRKMDNQVNVLRTLMDNSSLRQKRKEQQQITIELDELKSKIGDYDQRTILKEKMTLSTKCAQLQKEISTNEGTKTEVKVRIKELNTELNSPENKQAASNYKRKFFELKVQTQVTKDLLSYMFALEFCLTKFHQERMVQINKIIRQLWRSIYKGNDCDYIEIKAEETGGTTAKRAYKYRVVQMKNNVELDMRGRCSAGQKVLACLVIRMALAETFSRNCGILALDEPTTNLDRANILSLSEALARTVNTRRSEKNFQLIVITHDAEFLDTLTHTVDKVDHYWKVSRNEHGMSVIEKNTL